MKKYKVKKESEMPEDEYAHFAYVGFIANMAKDAFLTIREIMSEATESPAVNIARVHNFINLVNERMPLFIQVKSYEQPGGIAIEFFEENYGNSLISQLKKELE